MAERKGEKEEISREEEEQFWTTGQLGGRTSKSLLNTVYYHNEKCLVLGTESIVMQRIIILK